MGDGEECYTVVLHVYDLSQGLARQLSTSLLGKAIAGIWHTAICVYGLEYYFSGGIAKSAPAQSPFGSPVNVMQLGSTQVPKEVFEEYLNEISPRYTAQTYNLLKHNCNNFSNEVAQFLIGKEIPDYILRLPEEVMSSPLAPLILPLVDQVETTLRYGGVPQVPQQVAARTSPATAPTTVTSSGATSPPSTVPGAPVISVGPLPAAAAAASASASPAAAASLADAKAKVHEEISREFAALMASGSLRASEAAALAARKVMQRHGIGRGVPSGTPQPQP